MQYHSHSSRTQSRAVLMGPEELKRTANRIFDIIAAGHKKLNPEIPLGEFLAQIPDQALYQSFVELNGKELPAYDHKDVSLGATLRTLLMENLQSR